MDAVLHVVDNVEEAIGLEIFVCSGFNDQRDQQETSIYFFTLFLGFYDSLHNL